MTLAERICEHCAPDQRQAGFGSLMGATYPLHDLVDRYQGRRIAVARDVDLLVPQYCRWQTKDQADGGVQVEFSEPCPVVAASTGPLHVNADVTSLVLRLGAEAVKVQAQLRMFPDFTLTIPLESRDAAD